MESIKGKVALITGGGSGLGRATAKLMASHGAKVVVSDISREHGMAVVKEIEAAGGTACFIAADVGKNEDCVNLIAGSVEKYGSVDMAVNNAGIGGESNAVADMSTEGWLQVININLNSVFYCMKAELQQMQKQGKGSIVNMSSILGQVGFVNAAGYVAAKHGVVGLTKTAALEYSSRGIRINAVGPAFINTPLLDSLDAEMKQALITQHPIGRLGEANEVAELVMWLCSDSASFVTGGYYAVDGGYLSR